MAIIQCRFCGGMVSDQAPSCPHCGATLSQGPQGPVYPNQPYQQYSVRNPNDHPDSGLNVLSFFFPYVGWILYFVFKEQTPLKAKSCAKWSWIGFAVAVVFTIAVIVLAVLAEEYY